MAEYRVTALIYRFESLHGHDRFDKAAPLTGSLGGDFDFTLVNGMLEAVPTSEFRDRDLARDALEPLLRSWEQTALLAEPPHHIAFEYERSSVEEVDPSPHATTVFPETAHARGVAFDAVIERQNPVYPGPDPDFRSTSDTDVLMERLRRVRDGESELPTTAYFVLTTVEGRYGGESDQRRNAATALAIDYRVLDRLGAITDRADPDLGRKGKGDPTPFTPAELKWIDAVVVRLIRRVGEHGAGGTLTTVSMADFPALP